MSGRYELCDECGSPTGRAGVGEDSLFIGECGPYCEDCFEAMPEIFALEAAHQKIIVARLRALNAELVGALEVFIAQEVDYMTRNNLGDPEQQQAIITARALISRAREQSDEGGGS